MILIECPICGNCYHCRRFSCPCCGCFSQVLQGKRFAFSADGKTMRQIVCAHSCYRQQQFKGSRQNLFTVPLTTYAENTNGADNEIPAAGSENYACGCFA